MAAQLSALTFVIITLLTLQGLLLSACYQPLFLAVLLQFVHFFVFELHWI